MISNDVRIHIEDHIQSKIISDHSIGGGSIADSSVIKTDDNRTLFIKTGYYGDMFLKEANSLIELAKANALRTPTVIVADKEFLLLEYIKSGIKGANFFKAFGEQLAYLHKFQANSFGFKEDNFIGRTLQINVASGTKAYNWTNFYFENRLLYQFKLAEKNGFATPEMRTAFSGVENKIESILSDSIEPPTLLHGDLWGGNYMVDNNGKPVLIDPAVYYGHREADLAMTKVFGGFTDEFYDAYNAYYPLKDGYEYREPIYKLYHIFNHLNSFGSSYYNEVIHLLRYYL